MKRDIIIVGGGAIGLMNAYMLQKAGRSVTVIDKGDMSDCTSYGNAGLLSAFEKHPLSSPGIISKTIKLMLQGKSPVLLNPTLDKKILKWLFEFAKNANHARLKRTLILFERYGEMAMELYKQIQAEEELDFDFHQDGLLLVFTEEKSFEERLKGAQDKEKYTILNAKETVGYMPFLQKNTCGSLLLRRNGHIDPARMMNAMKCFLEKKGVEFIKNEEIIHTNFSQNRVESIASRNNIYEADEFIFATGADVTLAKKAGSDLLLTPAKGYSITFKMPEHLKPKTCALFNDLFIACTPRRDNVRLTSKLEIAAKDERVHQDRIESIIKNLKAYSTHLPIENPELWSGFRPLTPNDMPLIGRDENYKNLTHATGLGWLGITFAPAIGKIVSDLLLEDKSNKESTDILLFSGFYQG